MIKTHLLDTAKQIYNITICLSPTEIQGFSSYEAMRRSTVRSTGRDVGAAWWQQQSSRTVSTG